METADRIPIEGGSLEAILEPVEGQRALVVFAHGAGSSRLSPRNRHVADYLRSTGEFGTLLFDLLTPEEDRIYENRFDIDLLTKRLVTATHWVRQLDCCPDVPIVYFGASTGAAAALRAAATLADIVPVVVSRGGRPDLAGDSLPFVRAQVLLIVGGADEVVAELNERARRQLTVRSEFAFVPGAGHLFEERGALEHVERLTLGFLERQFAAIPR